MLQAQLPGFDWNGCYIRSILGILETEYGRKLNASEIINAVNYVRSQGGFQDSGYFVNWKKAFDAALAYMGKSKIKVTCVLFYDANWTCTLSDGVYEDDWSRFSTFSREGVSLNGYDHMVEAGNGDQIIPYNGSITNTKRRVVVITKDYTPRPGWLDPNSVNPSPLDDQ